MTCIYWLITINILVRITVYCCCCCYYYYFYLFTICIIIYDVSVLSLARRNWNPMLFSSQTSKGVTTRASSVQEILRALWLLCNLADFIRIHKMIWFATSRPSLRVRLCEGLSGDDYDSRGNGGWLVRGNTGHASLFPSLRDRWGKKSCLISWHDVALIVDLFSFGLLMIWNTLSSGIRKDVDYHEESKRNREC